ncbi:enoyl-CoA hydratase-related protein [Pseudooceanicola sp. C21-150M6]|uniref:enoyl-CoA hydratase-related protein n=1 Tax=Pseudooceanicola sp. C21-150M6 TaxID=3434355 RepID=UPI003D7FF044
MSQTPFPPNWHPDRTFAEGRIGFRIADRVAVVAVQIPQKHNALDEPATAGLVDALAAAEDAGARALLLTGIGGKAFISGADVSGFDGPRPTGTDFIDRQRILSVCPIPTIAVIHGYCIGGGLMTALNCDFRLAATGSSFGVPAARLGLSYGTDGLRGLVETIGPARTRRLLYLGDRIDADTALAWGLVEHLYPPEELWTAAMEMAKRIAANAPMSISATKQTVADILADPDRRDPDRIAALGIACKDSRDFREGRDAFREKRAPRFEGR